MSGLDTVHPGTGSPPAFAPPGKASGSATPSESLTQPQGSGQTETSPPPPSGSATPSESVTQPQGSGQTETSPPPPSGSATPSESGTRQLQASLETKTTSLSPSASTALSLSVTHQRQASVKKVVIASSEIEQIWRLRKSGSPCPGPGDQNRFDLHILAEDFYKEQAKEAAQRFDAYSNHLATSNNDLYQVVGFYSVFQGVLLSASAQSNLLCCSNWWIPISLCALATVCTCWGIFLKLKQVREFREQRNTFNTTLNHRISQLVELRRYSRINEGVTFTPSNKGDSKAWENLIFLAIFAFSGIIGGGSYTILCKPGTPC